MLAAVLPFAGAHVQALAQSCDNQTLPGGPTCATTVGAGATVTGTIVNSGATQRVRGTANATVINASGSQAVSSGGLATTTVIAGGGVQSVLSGGSAIGAVVSGGTQYVSSGGVATNTQVLSGGSMGVSRGGVANGASVASGGLQRVYSGGLANGTVISGGTQYISAGGSAVSASVTADGTQTVFSGGSANATVVSGGTQYVSSGGVASGTQVLSGGSMGVSRGGVANGASVASGGLQRVYSGGLTSGTQVQGGKQYVSGGGLAVDTTVAAGSLTVFARGSASGATIAGGAMTVSSGGDATGTTVGGGAQQAVLLGGSIEQTTVAAGGTLTVDVGGTTAQGTTAAAPVQGLALTGTLNIAEASTDALTGGAAIALSGLAMSGGTVVLGAPGSGGYKTVSIDGLSGSGQFVMNTNVGAQQADRLVVSQGSGTFTLSVHDASTAPPTSATERLLLVDATGSTATFSLPVSAMDVGAYKFGLQDVSGQYYLYNTGQRSDIASVAQAAASLPALLWYAQVQQTVSHLDDYRGGVSEGGLWVRAFDQQLRTDPAGTSASTEFYGAQIGRDWRVATRGGSWYVGVTGGFGQAHESFDDIGGGTARPWNLGVYGSYDNPSGVFADAIVRYTGLRENLSVTTAANAASASYSQNGYALSLDGGRRLALAGRWWAEPRVSVTYQHSGAVDYGTTLGTPIALAASNLVFSDAGVSFGGSFAVGDMKLEPFVRLGATHVFGGDLTDTVGGTALQGSMPRTWFSASAGLSAALSAHVRAYGAFTAGKGHDYTQPWAVTVGLSYAE